MKNRIIMLGVLFITITTYAQVQISYSTGYAIGSANTKLGEKISSSQTVISYGSYGEGTNFQLRVGYFFNDTFGVDLGIAYLYGADQIVTKVSLPNQEVNAIARGRAFGASPSVVYRFTNNLYGRFGALIKIGGRTEAVVYNKVVFSEVQATAQGLPLGSYSETNYVQDFHGRLPLGFIGAFGYKYDLNKSWSLFLEAEYLGISIKRNDSELAEFNTDIKLPDGTVAVAGFYTLDNLPEGFNRTTTYVDELSNTNTDSSIELAQAVPYSSFGLNFGITYQFGN